MTRTTRTTRPSAAENRPRWIVYHGVVDHLYVNDRLTIPAAELRESFVRSGGPGGQNVNKVATKVELRWAPADSAALDDGDRERLLRRLGEQLNGAGDLIVTATGTRDQARNRRDARRKLAALVAAALAPPRPRRRPTRPSRGAVERRLEHKKQRGQLKRRRRGLEP
jgi:ribosome-associated protein